MISPVDMSQFIAIERENYCTLKFSYGSSNVIVRYRSHEDTELREARWNSRLRIFYAAPEHVLEKVINNIPAMKWVISHFPSAIHAVGEVSRYGVNNVKFLIHEMKLLKVVINEDDFKSMASYALYSRNIKTVMYCAKSCLDSHFNIIGNIKIIRFIIKHARMIHDKFNITFTFENIILSNVVKNLKLTMEIMELIEIKIINIRNIPNDDLLRYVIRYGCLDVIKFFIQKYHDWSHCGDFLNAACLNGNVEVLKYIMERFNVIPTSDDIQSACSSIEMYNIVIGIVGNQTIDVGCLWNKYSFSDPLLVLQLFENLSSKEKKYIIEAAISTHQCLDFIKRIISQYLNDNKFINSMYDLSQYHRNKKLSKYLKMHIQRVIPHDTLECVQQDLRIYHRSCKLTRCYIHQVMKAKSNNPCNMSPSTINRKMMILLDKFILYSTCPGMY